MRVASSLTAVTWLPFGALDALPNLPLGLAIAHYDEPPPACLSNLRQLREADAFREANELRAWIDVEDGAIVDFGHTGRSSVPEESLELGAEQIAFPAVEFPAIRPDPVVGDGWVRFVQTAGGRLGLPAPRAVSGKPYVHLGSALAWTTLELVLHADGRTEGRLHSASPFPRHSLYDADGNLLEERGLTDFDGWFRDSFGEETPWPSEIVAGALEARIDEELTRVACEGGAVLARRRLGRGETLVEQGRSGEDMFLLLDGVLDVVIDGETVAQVGAGALVGERAVLGDGKRTATLRASRASRVAVLAAGQIRRSRLAELALASNTGAS